MIFHLDLLLLVLLCRLRQQFVLLYSIQLIQALFRGVNSHEGGEASKAEQERLLQNE